MLVLGRKIEEGLRIGENIEIRILDVFATDASGSRKSKVASIGINAPRDIPILRKELVETGKENVAAQRSAAALADGDLASSLRRKLLAMPKKELPHNPADTGE